ncbi:MAG: hypothetical protein RIQ60_3488 [Pseudomonadota bacterium]|jgi:fucose permease
MNPDPTLPTLPLALEGAGTPAERAPNLSRARRATRKLFATLGVMAGAWGAHVPSIKHTYGLDEGTLAAVLFCAAVGAVCSLFIAGRLIGVLGAKRASLLTGLVLTAALGCALLWPSAPWLMVANLVFGASMSVFDVSINAEGTALEQHSERPLMGNLHGCFSLGAMAGAALVAALLRAGITPALQLVGVALASAAVMFASNPGMLDARPGPAAEGDAPSHFVWPRGLLLVIGLLIFAGMTAEGVMYDWCVLYLKQEVGMPQDQAALGYSAFAGAMAVARFGGDSLRARFSEASLLRNSALLAAAAMSVVLLSASPGVALIGYTLVGAGLAPIVPILFSAASRVPGTTSAAAIAAASSIGYSGFLVGPPLIGAIAHNASLTLAMGVVVLATAALALGARKVG